MLFRKKETQIIVLGSNVPNQKSLEETLPDVVFIHAYDVAQPYVLTVKSKHKKRGGVRQFFSSLYYKFVKLPKLRSKTRAGDDTALAERLSYSTQTLN